MKAEEINNTFGKINTIINKELKKTEKDKDDILIIVNNFNNEKVKLILNYLKSSIKLLHNIQSGDVNQGDGVNEGGGVNDILEYIDIEAYKVFIRCIVGNIKSFYLNLHGGCSNGKCTQKEIKEKLDVVLQTCGNGMTRCKNDLIDTCNIKELEKEIKWTTINGDVSKNFQFIISNFNNKDIFINSILHNDKIMKNKGRPEKKFIIGVIEYTQLVVEEKKREEKNKDNKIIDTDSLLKILQKIAKNKNYIEDEWLWKEFKDKQRKESYFNSHKIFYDVNAKDTDLKNYYKFINNGGQQRAYKYNNAIKNIFEKYSF